MKKIVALLLVFVMVFALCACGGSTVDSNKITNENQAINTVKGWYDTPDRICDALGFVMYANPDYGVCSANQNSDGTWDVVLKGKMTGSMNETKTDIRVYGFEFKVSGLESMDDYKIGKCRRID